MTDIDQPINIVAADYTNPQHAEAIVQLMDHYASGASGGGEPLPGDVKKRLVGALANSMNATSWLAYCGASPAGLLNAFETLSTFRALPLVNIHDIFVHEAWRRRGIGRLLLQAVEDHARSRGCCKLTLEVLEGNRGAQALYRDLGFDGYSLHDDFGRALFWQKLL